MADWNGPSSTGVGGGGGVGFSSTGAAWAVGAGGSGGIGLAAVAQPANRGKQFVFNEHTMQLHDTATGMVWNVSEFSVQHRSDLMRDLWVFRCSRPGMAACLITTLPDHCEAYLKQGTPMPRTDADIFFDRGGTISGDRSIRPTSQEDNDMAQRHDFTFDYTGTEIAKAIDARIAEVKDKIKAASKHNLDALIEANLITEDKKRSVETSVEAHKSKIETWEREQRPYAKAGAKKFALDAEDVAHFGL